MQSKTRYPRLLIFILFIAALAGTYLITKQIYSYKGVSNTADTCILKFEVVDGFTDMPITDAVVVIPEINKEFRTNSAGFTDSIEVPVIKDTRFDAFLPQDWGGITVLVYKKGYTEYALFYTNTKPKYTRPPIKIYLFSNDNVDSDQPFSIIEGPDRNWVKDVLKKYRPANH